MRVAILAAFGLWAGASMAADEVLQVQARIPLPRGTGRIDHLAFDATRRLLYVAELGNDSVAVVDIDRRQLSRRLQGIDEPQGIAYSAELQRLYVASGGDGTVRAYDSTDLSLVRSIKLTGDADNIRIDTSARRVYVGYGDGALAVLDAVSLEKLGEIPLKGHPESFQLSPTGGQIFVNIPDAHEIAVVERTTAKQTAAWPIRWAANYPMALSGDAVLAVFRSPARIARFSTQDGKATVTAEVCGDADDVFTDARRKRLYVVCGAGVVDVLDELTLKRIARISTSPGARTGLYSPVTDLLFVAARAQGGSEAAVWVMKPID